MIQRVNPDLKKYLVKYGIQDWNECFHCGNCTAICPLTDQGFLFPRKAIRQVQMGLKTSLASNFDPWLCYYCGECSETCPRDANPGELMMSLRRYLTSVYDWTGFSKLFYTKKIWEFLTIIILFILVIASFVVWFPKEQIANFTTYIGDHSFLKVIEAGDLIMAAVVAFVLISNIFRMWYLTILKPKYKVPFIEYFRGIYVLPGVFASQISFRKCDTDGRLYWVNHLLLMTGYTLMFILVVVFLPKFQVSEVYNWYHWQRLLGYYATFGLLFGLSAMFIGRWRKKSEKFKFSHLSDWLFIIMLFLTTLTGILVHIFRLADMPYATYYLYIIHLAVLVPMICVEVPFSKWSHLAYRPFSIYFYYLKKAALSKQHKSKLAAAA